MVNVLADVLPWTDAGGRTEAIIKNLDLQHGYEYVLSVRATNGAALQSTGTSEPIMVDLTPPEGIEVVEFVQETVDGHPNSVKFEFTFGVEPETEVAAHYFALGTTESTGDLFPWTEALLDYGRIADLPVTAGTPIYLLVKGVNVLGLETVVTAELQLSLPDNSPPPAPMVVTDPQQSSTDGSELAIGWNQVEDPESAIVSYAYGISREPIEDPEEEPDILAWAPVDRAGEPYYIGKRPPDVGTLPVEEEEGGSAGGGVSGFGYTGYVQAGFQVVGAGLGTDYEVLREDLALSGRVYAVVKVTNGAGLSAVSCSPPIIFDASPPETAHLQAEPQQSNLAMLRCRLNAGDPQSGIQAYRYEVYRVQEGPTLAWTASTWQDADAPAEGEISRTIQITAFPAPGLQYDNAYEVRFWVRNRAGLMRSTNPVTIEMVLPPEEEGVTPDQQQFPGGKKTEGMIDIRRRAR
jgi:hypothetical protein